MAKGKQTASCDEKPVFRATGRIPADWLPDVPMHRIVCHWTAGGYKATPLDREHYHIVIEDDCTLVRGDFSIADNVEDLVWEPRNYAAHTRATNSGAIGISVACMEDADEDKGDFGACPMLEEQWLKMAEVAAQLCRHYGIPVTPQTVLGHGEVQDRLGNPQDGKWDPLVLPWDPTVRKRQVGNRFRALVRKLIKAGA